MQPSPWNDERITAYVLGELSADESTRLEADMKTSPEIADAVAEARGITDQLSAMYAAEPPMTLDSAKRDEILDSSVPATRPPSAVLATEARGPAKQLLALAATVLLVGSLAMWLYAERHSVQMAKSDRVASAPDAALPPANENGDAVTEPPLEGSRSELAKEIAITDR